MDIVLLLGLLMVGEGMIFLPFIIIGRLGGWPEGFWRLLRIKYFVFWIIDADNTLNRHVMIWKNLKTHSPTYFDFHDKRFYIDKSNTLRSKGRPAWAYLPDNAFPVPILTKDRDKILDPEKIQKAFRTHVVKEMFRLRELTNKQNQRNYMKYLLYGVVFLGTIYILVAFHVI